MKALPVLRVVRSRFYCTVRKAVQLDLNGTVYELTLRGRSHSVMADHDVVVQVDLPKVVAGACEYGGNIVHNSLKCILHYDALTSEHSLEFEGTFGGVD